MERHDTKSPEIGLVWGGAAIGQAIGVSPRPAFYLLENGLIPAKKVGTRWCATREDLRRHFSVRSETEAP